MTRTFASQLPTARRHVHWNERTGKVEIPEAAWDRTVSTVITEIGNGEYLHEALGLLRVMVSCADQAIEAKLDECLNPKSALVHNARCLLARLREKCAEREWT